MGICVLYEEEIGFLNIIQINFMLQFLNLFYLQKSQFLNFSTLYLLNVHPITEG